MNVRSRAASRDGTPSSILHHVRPQARSRALAGRSHDLVSWKAPKTAEEAGRGARAPRLTRTDCIRPACLQPIAAYTTRRDGVVATSVPHTGRFRQRRTEPAAAAITDAESNGS